MLLLPWLMRETQLESWLWAQPASVPLIGPSSRLRSERSVLERLVEENQTPTQALGLSSASASRFSWALHCVPLSVLVPDTVLHRRPPPGLGTSLRASMGPTDSGDPLAAFSQRLGSRATSLGPAGSPVSLRALPSWLSSLSY